MFMDAVQREKTIKHWSRAWKIALVEKSNPGWVDLYGQLI
jgi:putative endonuclease